jgi:hypothetical protein
VVTVLEDEPYEGKAGKRPEMFMSEVWRACSGRRCQNAGFCGAMTAAIADKELGVGGTDRMLKRVH